MKASNDLFQLIKSMTPREKSYFKRFSGLQSDKRDKHYLTLFAAIDKQSSYDEAAIKKKLAKEKWIKHFSYEKGYLYKLILKSLASFYADNTFSKKIDTLKQQAVTLLDRSLYDAGMKILQRAIKEAKKYEQFTLWLELIELEITAIVGKLDSGHEKYVKRYTKERKKIMRKMQNLDQYIRLRFIIFNIQDEKGFVGEGSPSKAFEKLRVHKLLQSPDTALSLRAKERFYYTFNLMRFVNRSFEQWHKGYADYIRFMEAHTYMFDINSFSTLYVNYMLACIKVLDKKGFEDTVVKMGVKIKHTGIKQMANEKAMIHSRTLDLNSHLGEFDAGLAYFRSIEEGLEKEAELYLDFTKGLIYYQVTRTLLESGLLEEAQTWVNKLIAIPETTLSAFRITSRLIFVIIHYELGNLSVVETELRSISRTISTLKKRDSFQATLVRFFRKLVKSGGNPTLIRQSMSSFRDDLSMLANDQSVDTLKEYFHLIEWLESKVSGVSFAELVAQKVATRTKRT